MDEEVTVVVVKEWIYVEDVELEGEEAERSSS